MLDEKARPPYVTFETKAIERRDLQGAITFEDVDYAYVTPMGSKDRFEQIVSEWFTKLEDAVVQERFRREWLAEFKAAYKAYKEGKEPPINGTSIKNWAVLSPAQTKTLLNLKVFTIEDIAGANEETIARMGMGGRALKDQAKNWLASQTKDGLAALVAKQEAMQLQLEDVLARNIELEKGNKELQGLLAAATKETA